MRTAVPVLMVMYLAVLTGCDDPEPAAPVEPVITDTATVGDVPVLEDHDGTLSPTTPPSG